jgi:hypothetical protein
MKKVSSNAERRSRKTAPGLEYGYCVCLSLSNPRSVEILLNPPGQLMYNFSIGEPAHVSVNGGQCERERGENGNYKCPTR